MTKLEKHVLAKILKQLQYPSAPGIAFDSNFQPVEVEGLVPGTPNYRLLDNDLYKAGYKHCYNEFVSYLVLLTSSKEAMVKYAGKP